jgi:hypothetical protein
VGNTVKIKDVGIGRGKREKGVPGNFCKEKCTVSCDENMDS